MRSIYTNVFLFDILYFASEISRAVKFTSKLFGRALSRRIKATVLYATETGKSEQYAKQLVELLGHAFNAQVRIICGSESFYTIDVRRRMRAGGWEYV